MTLRLEDRIQAARHGGHCFRRARPRRGKCAGSPADARVPALVVPSACIPLCCGVRIFQLFMAIFYRFWLSSNAVDHWQTLPASGAVPNVIQRHLFALRLLRPVEAAALHTRLLARTATCVIASREVVCLTHGKCRRVVGVVAGDDACRRGAVLRWVRQVDNDRGSVVPNDDGGSSRFG